MKKKIYLILIFLAFFFSACKTTNSSQTSPNTKQVTPDSPVTDTAKKPVTDTPVKPATDTKPAAVSADDNTIIAQFDSFSVTKHIFNVTKTEIQLVVEDLNTITNSRDYNRWLTYLSEEYRINFSNPAVLEKVTASLPTKGVKVLTLKDYFTYVFVPSRQNMRVDDITFVSPTRVYVIMEIAPKQPAAIYILEKTGEGWKLVLKNQ